jgi:hypothetical protein
MDRKYKFSGDYIPEILSDILARISKNGSCVAVALYTDKTIDNKYRLNKFFTCTKKTTEKFREEMFNLLCYASHSNNNVRLPISNVIKKFINENKLDFDDNNLAADNYKVYLEKFIEYIIQNFGESKLEDEKVKKNLGKILLYYVDILVLPEIISNYFSQFVENENDIDLINKNHFDIHPDTRIAQYLKLDQNYQDVNYIGTSFMCCILCALYLKQNNFNYRGICKRYFYKWKHPESNCDSVAEFLKGIKIENVRVINQNNTFGLIDKERELDECQKINDIESNDICHLLKFLPDKEKILQLYNRIFTNEIVPCIKQTVLNTGYICMLHKCMLQ